MNFIKWLLIKIETLALKYILRKGDPDTVKKPSDRKTIWASSQVMEYEAIKSSLPKKKVVEIPTSELDKTVLHEAAQTVSNKPQTCVSKCSGHLNKGK